MMSPTSSTTTSVPFFSATASAATSARCSEEDSATGTGVKRRSTCMSSRDSVEPPGPDPPYHRRRHHAVDRTPGREPFAQVGGRDVEPGDRDPLEAPSLAGRLGLGRRPAARCTTTVARSRVSSRRRQVPMLATASAPRTRNSSRPGRVQRLERVGGDRRALPLDLDRAGLDAVDPVDGQLHERSRSVAGATTLPRFCQGSPATTSSTRSSERAAAPRRPRRCGRRAPDRRCRRTRRSVPVPVARPASSATADLSPNFPASLRACPVFDRLGETSASSSPLAIPRGRATPPAGERARARVAPRPSGCARSGRVPHRFGRRRHRRHRRPRARDRVAVDEFAVSLSRLGLARAHGPRDRGGRRCVGRGGPRRRLVPRPPPRRARVRGDAVRDRLRRDAAEEAGRHTSRRVPRRLGRAARRRAVLAIGAELPRRAAARSRSPPGRRVAAGRGRHDRSRGPRGRRCSAPTTRRCWSGATVIRSDGASGRSSSRSPASPTAPGTCSRDSPTRAESASRPVSAASSAPSPNVGHAHVAVVVFTRDLRITDHPALAAAAATRGSRRAAVRARRRDPRRRVQLARTAPGSCSSRSPTSTPAARGGREPRDPARRLGRGLLAWRTECRGPRPRVRRREWLRTRREPAARITCAANGVHVEVHPARRWCARERSCPTVTATTRCSRRTTGGGDGATARGRGRTDRAALPPVLDRGRLPSLAELVDGRRSPR